ncbi:hypothetical protein [Synechococcus elongatus]|uniref:Uncharacterized protein n=1 Tax=Synechococcus elongatus PCC 11801 TaxID=2219813 RepID=A0AAN1UUG2_SYNEL|nr:hypothetical protein [Synechococcus elongatus]AZB72549.1 hypothetical protein DOP62_07305 [Synechococcus elongatus PCC 11801]
MTGFIRGLFQGKPKAEQAQQPKQKAESFYLDADEAKSLGNLDYIRSASTIEHTFPKTASNPEERVLIQKVSSLSVEVVEASEGLPQAEQRQQEALNKAAAEAEANKAPTKTFAGQTETSETSSRRRSTGDLDMFRQMARDLKK